METSAKTGDNIEVAFKSLIEDVYNKFHKNFESITTVEIIRGKTIKIQETKTEKKKCCSKESFPFLHKTK
jgi:GTPase SAR1 family protein